MNITLRRISFSKDAPTYGVMILQDIPLCVTVERPWLDNQKNASCIPPGVYKCSPHNGAQFKDVWKLENVPGRSAILIHAGNTSSDVQGCIAVGQAFYNGGISNSRMTMDMLRKTLPEHFTLEIINP